MVKTLLAATNQNPTKASTGILCSARHSHAMGSQTCSPESRHRRGLPFSTNKQELLSARSRTLSPLAMGPRCLHLTLLLTPRCLPPAASPACLLAA